MKKLNTKGFAHQVVLLAVLVVLAIGGIGSYIYLNSSSAATKVSPAKQCAKKKGVYFKSSCLTSGAYLYAGGTKVKVTSGQSKRVEHPEYLVVATGRWKVCDDKTFADICSYTEGSKTAFRKGIHSLKKDIKSYEKTATGLTTKSLQYNYSTKTDVYAEKL